jgi:hypothetical protein
LHTTLTAFEGISGTKYYDVPTAGEENIKTIPLYTGLQGFQSAECESQVHMTLDVQLPRGGNPIWVTIWDESEEARRDPANMMPDCHEEMDAATMEMHIICDNQEIDNKEAFIRQSGDFNEIVINLSEETFIDTVQVELENTSNTIDAKFRVAFRDEQNTVIEGPTQSNEFYLVIQGNEQYVNPCAQVDAQVKSEIERDFKIAFANTDTTMVNDLKHIEAQKPLEIVSTDASVDCPLFYKLYV